MIKYVAALFSWLAMASAQGLEPEKIFENVSPSIWVVHVFDAEGIRKGSGSAVVVGHEELITNCHVLMKARSVSIKRENTAHSANLVHADVDRDLCIIRAKGLAAAAVRTAPLSSVKVGQRVYTIGAPLGYELTLADGLVSSLKRDGDDVIRSIQISVPISPGSSGGGLFDQDGRLIGITTGSRPDGQNLNFAIPAEWIVDVPQRSAAALAEYRKPPAPPKTQTEGQPVTVAANERQLQGDELRSHFASLGKISAKLMQRDIVLDRRGSARISVLDRASGISASGQYRFEGQNQVCLNLFIYGSVNPLSALRDCFGVFDAGSKSFLLRARDGTTVSYQLN